MSYRPPNASSGSKSKLLSGNSMNFFYNGNNKRKRRDIASENIYEGSHGRRRRFSNGNKKVKEDNTIGLRQLMTGSLEPQETKKEAGIIQKNQS